MLKHIANQTIGETLPRIGVNLFSRQHVYELYGVILRAFIGEFGKLTNVQPIILCGGLGKRLWPKSRALRPKQFAKFGSQYSLLQQTSLRFSKSRNSAARNGIDCNAPIIVGATHFGETIKAEMDDISTQCKSIILEPFGMNSAPALAVSLVDVLQQDPEAICCMLPSDHAISNLDGFFQCVSDSITAIDEKSWIVTIGIEPNYPETQYGYIEKSADHTASKAFAVAGFHEKPDIETAQKFLASGNFYWNSGMFFFKASDMKKAFEEHAPVTWEYAQKAVQQGKRNDNVVELNPEMFSKCEALSIDYAIMEKAENLGIVPSQFRWSDLGLWNQIHETSANKDAYNNVLSGDVIAQDVRDSLVISTSKLVAVAGVSNLVVVEDGDSILIVDKAKSALVKDLVEELDRKKRPEISEIAGAGSVSASAAKDWLASIALPFWAQYGLDKKSGGVFEHLCFDGQAAKDEHKRFRVLPRQIYCFAEGKLFAPDNGVAYDEILRALFEHMVETGWHADGGWIHHYNPDGSVKNPLRDTYDQCFVLLACASLHKATKWPIARQWAGRTLDWMDRNLADGDNGGYFENSDRSGPRRANPHMHFLEAMLAWYEATGEAEFLDKAIAIIDLFEAKFFNQDHGVIAEFFDEKWNELSDEVSQLVEPGHHYEWASLLLGFDKISARDGLRQKALRLISHANSFGHLSNGVVRDYVGRLGEHPAIVENSGKVSNARCWPQTEGLKAALACQELDLPFGEQLKNQMLSALFTHYLINDKNKHKFANENAQSGGWNDALNEQGEPISTKMPASTFYHIVSALTKL